MPKRTWEICPACRGEGTCVNPAIDSNGLTREDFDADPDFAEAYMEGAYDITCEACGGRGSITTDRIEELREHAADRRLAAMEDGRWGELGGLSDMRWG